MPRIGEAVRIVNLEGRDGRPVVTLVVAMLDEADSIGACLASVLHQDYPADHLEILVYDGGSSDGSPEIARRVVGDRPLAEVRPNPRRIQAAAWNLGIEAARGDIVGILSGHAALAPGYVSAAVAALERTGASMVGGPVRAIGTGLVGEAIAAATSTRFGAGGARFRLAAPSGVAEEVDTVYMGLAARSTYLRFPFDEQMVRNQDDELSYRLRDAGGTIVCDPAIESVYRSRATLRSLARQYWAYGCWKVPVLQKHPDQARVRHLVPPTFVAGLAGAAVLLPLGGMPRLVGASGIATYAVANIVASVAASRRRPRLLLALPAAYCLIHASYGSGFLVGLVRFRHGWPAGSLGRIGRALVRRRRPS